MFVSLRSADRLGNIWTGEVEEFFGFGWQSRSCRLQRQSDGDGGGADCNQDSILLARCWG